MLSLAQWCRVLLSLSIILLLGVCRGVVVSDGTGGFDFCGLKLFL